MKYAHKFLANAAPVLLMMTPLAKAQAYAYSEAAGADRKTGSSLNKPSIKRRWMNARFVFFSVVMFFMILFTLAYVFQGKPKNVSPYVSYSGDALISQLIKHKFLSHKDVAGTSISIKAVDGEVLLSGFAKSDEEKSAAEGIAHRVPGVKTVKNEVAVRP